MDGTVRGRASLGMRVRPDDNYRLAVLLLATPVEAKGLPPKANGPPLKANVANPTARMSQRQYYLPNREAKSP